MGDASAFFVQSGDGEAGAGVASVVSSAIPGQGLVRVCLAYVAIFPEGSHDLTGSGMALAGGSFVPDPGLFQGMAAQPVFLGQAQLSFRMAFFGGFSIPFQPLLPPAAIFPPSTNRRKEPMASWAAAKPWAADFSNQAKAFS